MKIKKSFVLSAIALALSSSLAVAAPDNISPKFWWPDLLDLRALRQNTAESNPMEKSYNYAQQARKLDLKAVKKDIEVVMKTSQDWWPADYGTYAPFFIRLAWHNSGTYRTIDGRGGAGGGQQRFEALNSWPDNGSLDKARRLLWPVKQKYGSELSWGDLMVLSGNVALESMGFDTFGYGLGRIDDWQTDMVYWGPETNFMGDKRHSGARELAKPLGATQMGLIYVNPEGPNGNPDPIAAAHDIRTTFARMAMNDEETVALIAGGHTFGKAHGAHSPEKCVGPAPAAAGIEEQGLGWRNSCGKGNAEDAVTSGLEGAWSATPTTWSNQYLDNLFNFDWVQTKSPAGAIQWIPADGAASNLVPDAHLADKRHAPMMFTTDLSMKLDPSYSKIAKRFQENPKEYQLAFAKAWFKLTHRDLGPRARYIGSEVPKEDLIWQDPLPTADYKMIDTKDVAQLKASILSSGIAHDALIRSAWSAAASFRGTDMRGGANGARVNLAPQKDWQANNPAELAKVLSALEKIQTAFNSKQSSGKKVSLADLNVLAGSVAIEQAAKKAGKTIQVPFTPGRVDATQAQTDVNSFAVLEPKADAFRNYYAEGNLQTPTEMLVDRANMLTLTVPEMTVLLGGMRVLSANAEKSKHGVFTDRPGVLSNDFFVNLLSMNTKWSTSAADKGVYEGHDRASDKLKWTATPVDLIFGSNSELRAVAEVYAADNASDKFVTDFVSAWTKVMMLDRFDKM
jgi:catalase-peroxidase